MSSNDKITPTEAAKILGVDRSRVRQLVASGDLKTAGMFGSTTMFSLAVVWSLKRKRDGTKKNGHRKAAK